jgi:hypothetical protein
MSNFVVCYIGPLEGGDNLRISDEAIRLMANRKWRPERCILLSALSWLLGGLAFSPIWLWLLGGLAE